LRGIGEKQVKQQEQSEKLILKFMKNKKVNDSTHVQWCHTFDETGRCFWLRGIVRGTNLDYNTVTKAIERLVEKGKIWEWPKTRHVRIFQLTFKGWKIESRDFEKGLVDPNDIIKIPRGNTPKKQQRSILKKQISLLDSNFFKIATEKQITQLKKIIYQKNIIKANYESILFMKKITGFKFPKID